MFYYYGRKKRIAHLYPAPIFDRIIEPFAGSAAYSLHGNHWQKEVTLIDTNPIIIEIWNYLKNASSKDIQALPILEPGEKTTDFDWLSRAEHNLIGLHINPGSSSPKTTCTKFSRWTSGKAYILESLHKIKHWTISHHGYEKSINQIATWFIDPPYQRAGIYYIGGNELDFKALGDWCRSRQGQAIVCEAEGADWLPFTFLTKAKNAGKHSCREVIWS